MKGKKSLLILVLVLAVIIVGASLIYNNLDDYVEFKQLSQVQSQSDSQEANPAPDFTVFDKDGNPVKLSDLRGKPVVLNFWASWCGPCKSEMPDFDATFAQYKDDIHFMMVNLTDGISETVDSASSYIISQGYSFPVYYDLNADAAQAYGVYSIPMTFFIDADGNLVVYAKGAIDASSLQTGIDMIYTAS